MHCAKMGCLKPASYDRPLCYPHWREFDRFEIFECERCHRVDAMVGVLSEDRDLCPDCIQGKQVSIHVHALLGHHDCRGAERGSAGIGGWRGNRNFWLLFHRSGVRSRRLGSGHAAPRREAQGGGGCMRPLLVLGGWKMKIIDKVGGPSCMTEGRLPRHLNLSISERAS